MLELHEIQDYQDLGRELKDWQGLIVMNDCDDILAKDQEEMRKFKAYDKIDVIFIIIIIIFIYFFFFSFFNIKIYLYIYFLNVF